MRRRTAALLLLLGVGACTGAKLMLDKGPESSVLKVRIEGVRPEGGRLRLALYGRPEGFPGDPSQADRVEERTLEDLGEDGSLTWVVPGLGGGLWAVSVLHDEDDDGEMDRDWLGRPAEGWGVTNDAKGTFGPPSFEDAAVEVAGDTTSVVLHLRY